MCGATLAAGPATQRSTLAGESHQIQNLSQEELLRPRDADSKDGTPIVLYSPQDWKCMTWKFEPAGDGVRLINYFTHKTLYPGAGEDGSAVTQHPAAKTGIEAEQWRFVPVSDGVYRIEHIATGKTLGVNAEGNVIIETWTGAASQKWKLLEKPARFTG